MPSTLIEEAELDPSSGDQLLGTRPLLARSNFMTSYATLGSSVRTMPDRQSLHPRTQPDRRRSSDLCVVGGAASGLSAALQCARARLPVVVAGGRKIGWGASGRNWRSDIPACAKSSLELIGLYGEAKARSCSLSRSSDEPVAG